MSFVLGILCPLVLYIWSWIEPYKFRNAPDDNLLLGVIIWTLVNYYYSTKLVEVRVRNANENREQIKNIAQKAYPSVRFTSGTPALIRGQKPEGWSGRGKVVSIIINGDYIYVNILSTFSGGNFDVIFCGLINYLRAKSLSNEIEAAKL